tara:strand:- start:220 stop:573 length:354 start_codon:yes stop_codon:yes gene_type:complete
MGIQIGGQTVIHDTYHVTDIINVNASGIVTATKFKGDGSELEGIVSGIGINSTGTSIGADITTLNFVGAGNTFAVNGSTVDISISGEGGTPVIDAGDFNSASSLVSESTEIEGGDFG